MRHAHTYRNSQIPADSTKGLFFGGECNRTACDNSPATWFNTGTWAYYCRACADAIDWRKDRGITRLCVEVDHDLSVEEMDAHVKENLDKRIEDDKRLDDLASARRTNMQQIRASNSSMQIRMAALDAIFKRDDFQSPKEYFTLDSLPDPLKTGSISMDLELSPSDTRIINIQRAGKGVERKRKPLSEGEQKRVDELRAEAARQEQERQRLANERYAEQLRQRAIQDKPMIDAAQVKRNRKNAKRLANIR